MPCPRVSSFSRRMPFDAEEGQQEASRPRPRESRGPADQIDDPSRAEAGANEHGEGRERNRRHLMEVCGFTEE